jgi:integrating conjugative element protein (TIGR03755 family)
MNNIVLNAPAQQKVCLRHLRGIVLALTFASAALTAPLSIAATGGTQTVRQNSSLYYKAGGGDPAVLSANPNSLNLKFGLTGNALLGYSCGRFNLSAAFDYYMSEFRQLGATIQSAIGAAVMALPMYIFQRAQPGLYELFQSYWAKAQVAISAATKTCEEMEAQIKAGQNPYDDYINLAKGEGWKVAVNEEDNVIKAKSSVQNNGGKRGIEVFPGIKRGGEGQAPLRIVHDITAVGYNATMNQMPSASKDTTYPATTRLGRLWSTPRAAGDWAVSVLGDQEVTTCTEASCGTADSGIGKAVATGLGLQPKYEASLTEVKDALASLVASNDAIYENLESVSAPGVGVTRDVVDALRRLPATSRGTMTTRLSAEIALARTIERAFAIRNLLISGMSAANYEKPVDDARKRVEQLNRYIDDLLFETRVRKELVSNTAQLLIENDRNTAAARSTSVPPGREASPRPLEDGKVAQ